MVQVEKSDMPMWIITRQSPATVETKDAWSSLLPQPELSAWQKKSLRHPVRTVFSEIAVATMEKVGEQLGGSLAMFACVTDPETIVIGGGVSKAGQPLIDCIQKYYREYTFSSCKDTPIVIATLGNDAGIYGAAKMVL